MAQRHIIFANYTSSDIDELVSQWQIEKLLDLSVNLNARLTVVTAKNNVKNIQSDLQRSYLQIQRPNTGYDFGSWLVGLNHINVTTMDQVLFLNSSILGPFHFDENFWEHVFSESYDSFFIASSLQIREHFQSYFWRVSGSIANNKEFRKFLEKPLKVNVRENAIREKELRFGKKIASIGLKYKVLFPYGSTCHPFENPSLKGWERMLAGGFPFIKKSLLVETQQSNEKIMTKLRIALTGRDIIFLNEIRNHYIATQSK
jgi:lipopolysaccharide biosynthesis protein